MSYEEERRAQIEHNHTYHAPTPEQVVLYQNIREKAKEFALLVEGTCPDSEEKRYAHHYIDMATMNANAAIARLRHD